MPWEVQGLVRWHMAVYTLHADEELMELRQIVLEMCWEC